MTSDNRVEKFCGNVSAHFEGLGFTRETTSELSELLHFKKATGSLDILKYVTISELLTDSEGIRVGVVLGYKSDLFSNIISTIGVDDIEDDRRAALSGDPMDPRIAFSPLHWHVLTAKGGRSCWWAARRNGGSIESQELLSDFETYGERFFEATCSAAKLAAVLLEPKRYFPSHLPSPSIICRDRVFFAAVLHYISGEYDICQKLVSDGLSHRIDLGPSSIDTIARLVRLARILALDQRPPVVTIAP